MQERTCVACGALLMGLVRKDASSYCSNACRERARYWSTIRSKRMASRPVVQCAHCGESFRTWGNRKVYCSDSCRHRGPKKIYEPRPCEFCGDVFTPIKSERRYCYSRTCRNRRNRSYDPVARRRSQRSVNSRRRARLRGVEVESFRNVDVFERDGWVCGICGGDVDRDLVWPDHMSASLDHIVPVSKGGTHTLDNVQCSHFICNSLKQAGVLEVI